MGDLIKKFEGENKGVKVNINLGGSGALKNQIIAGAPVDLVFFASQKDLKDLDKKGLSRKRLSRRYIKKQINSSWKK